MQTINIGIPVDIQKLLDTRLLIQAGSGGGKSYLLRKLIESIGNKVQQIIIDPEGEFITLREQFDFALVAHDGDIPLNLKYAETLAHKLLETNLSAIIDLYELRHHERILFVQHFINAMINAPKDLWHSCFVYVDEAHIFCPESTKSESAGSVIDLCTRGRKRGFSAVLATQRLSKLHKDAAAECLNKMIGRIGQDIDRKRAADELGLINKNDIIALRDLQPGEFYGFGPAISAAQVIKFKVAPVLTTHLQAGKRITSAPPTPRAIQNILQKLDNIPEDAEKELNTKQELQGEITRLRAELAKKPAGQVPAANDSKLAAITRERNEVIKNLLSATGKINQLEQLRLFYEEQTTELQRILNRQPEIKYVQTGIKGGNSETKLAKSETKLAKVEYSEQQPSSGKVATGAMRMLKAAAMLHPKNISRTKMGLLARLSPTSGSFSTYLSTLRKENLLIMEGNDFAITNKGKAAAGNVEPLPTDPQVLVKFWCDIIGNNGASRMLCVLAYHYPRPLSKQELGTRVEMSHTSGSFTTYLSKLKSNSLIEVTGQQVAAAKELFE